MKAGERERENTHWSRVQ